MFYGLPRLDAIIACKTFGFSHVRVPLTTFEINCFHTGKIFY
jgi:hypothetical protein